jgi:NADPH2:quinone reductase
VDRYGGPEVLEVAGVADPVAGPRVRAGRGALAEVSAGRIEPVIGQSFPLIEAAQAHRSIESRDTLGKTLLLP